MNKKVWYAGLVTVHEATILGIDRDTLSFTIQLDDGKVLHEVNSGWLFSSERKATKATNFTSGKYPKCVDVYKYVLSHKSYAKYKKEGRLAAKLFKKYFVYSVLEQNFVFTHMHRARVMAYIKNFNGIEVHQNMELIIKK